MLNFNFMESRNDLEPVYSSRSFSPREKCGIFAVYNYRGTDNAALATYLGLMALQHRGQESAGMAFYDEKGIAHIKGMGLVEHTFSNDMLQAIKSDTVLGHVRYSTTGASYLANAQPLLARSVDQSGLALAHNGNLTNTRRLYDRLLGEGHIFHSTSDTEIMLSYLSRFKRQGLLKAVQATMGIVEGAYAAVVLDDTQMAAFRDPNGFRPLVMGRLNGAYIFASETAALDAVGANFIRDLEPGEIIVVSPDGLTSLNVCSGGREDREKTGLSLCIFEYVYFSRPDSVLDGKSVYEVRKKVGSLMAGNISHKLDLIIPSPDSGVTAAIGLAESLKLRLDWAVHRNPYLGRTFIGPSRGEREQAVRLKFNPIKTLVKGKKVAVVDDSLVRGTTARLLSGLLREAGAEEIHLLIASPPYRYPCYYGIDIPLAEDLASTNREIEQLASAIKVDSITFAGLNHLYDALGENKNNLCDACFTGNYPKLVEIRGMVS